MNGLKREFVRRKGKSHTGKNRAAGLGRAEGKLRDQG